MIYGGVIFYEHGRGGGDLIVGPLFFEPQKEGGRGGGGRGGSVFSTVSPSIFA